LKLLREEFEAKIVRMKEHNREQFQIAEARIAKLEESIV